MSYRDFSGVVRVSHRVIDKGEWVVVKSGNGGSLEELGKESPYMVPLYESTH